MILSIALFLGIFSILTLLLGLMGLLYPAFLVTFGSFVLFLALIGLLRFRQKAKFVWKFELWQLFLWTPLAVLFSAITASLFLSPPIFDELLYHLALPERFLLRHAVSSIPFNVYSNYPLNVEMLYVWGLLFPGIAVCRMINFALGSLSALVIYLIARKHFSREAGLMSVHLFLSMIGVGILFASAFNDFGLTFFCLMSLFTLMNWQEKQGRIWLVLTGVFCGFALGTKYTAVVNLGIIMLLVLMIGLMKKEKMKTQIIDLLLVLTFAFLTFSPWLIKNLWFTGNPVYPFFYEVFGGKGWNAFNAWRYGHFHGLAGPPAQGINKYLAMPSFLIFDFKKDIPLGFFWLIALPFLFFIKRSDKKSWLLMMYFIPYSILWGLGIMLIRLLFPAMAVFSILGGRLIAETTGKKRFFWAIFALLAVGVMFNAYMVMDYTRGVSSGSGFREGLDLRAIAGVANLFVPPGEKILFVGEFRTFGFKRDVLAPTMFDTNVAEDWLERSENFRDFSARLRREKIDYILFSAYRAAWAQDNFKYFEKPENYERFKLFLATAYVSGIAERGAYRLYRVNQKPSLLRTI